MAESLIIHKFGPISTASFDIKDFAVFIGDQATGKSTVAKLLAIFRDIDFVLNVNRDLNAKCAEFNIGNYFSQNTFISYHRADYSIEYSDGKLNVLHHEPFLNKIQQEKERIKTLIKEVVQLHPENVSEGESQSEAINRMYQSIWKQFFRIRLEPLYIPAERVLLSLIRENPFSFINDEKAISLSPSITNFGRKYQAATNRYKNFSIKFLDIEFKNEKGKHKVYLPNNVAVELHESASGYQSTIPMLMVLEDLEAFRKSDSFIIEEPELNLFPTTQRKLIHYITGKVNSKSSEAELVITTHSPYVLSSFNNLLFAFMAHSKHPQHEAELTRIVPKESWLDPERFCAYYFNRGGTVTNIFDQKTGLISENELDQVSEEIAESFDEIMNVYSSNQHS